MSASQNRVVSPLELVQVLRRHRNRWLIPAATITALAAVYALVRPATWEASLALVARDEASGGVTRPGKFTLSDAMKNSQETIMELAHSRPVLEAALKQVGRPDSVDADAIWPTAKHIEALEDSLKLTPPKGAEFGKTEVFYLKVKSNDRQRAVALTAAVCAQLQRQFEELRGQKAQSITAELEKTVSLAQSDLDKSTSSLTIMEQKVGRDLAELRMLSEQPSGDSDLRKIATEVANELRTHKAALKSNQELLSVLADAKENPGRLLASPSRLLESQPGLKRLKDGLVDAQLATAKLLGNMAPEHPQVRAAQAAEQEISQHLHNELAIAIKGVEVDLRLTQDRVDMLEEQQQAVRLRLERLAAMRADYSNLAATSKHRGDILKTAQQDLADARASQAASRTTSLINPVGEPDTGSRPIGPGRTMICLGGMLGGLALGIGILFFTVSPSEFLSPTAVASSTVLEQAPFVAAPLTPVSRPEPKKQPMSATPTVLSFKQALQKLSGGLN